MCEKQANSRRWSEVKFGKGLSTMDSVGSRTENGCVITSSRCPEKLPLSLLIDPNDGDADILHCSNASKTLQRLRMEESSNESGKAKK